MWAYGITKKTKNKNFKNGTRIDKPSSGIELFEVDVPLLLPGEVLIKTKASCLNFNTIWSSLAYPADPFSLISGHVSRNPRDIDHNKDYAIFGSDVSGIITEVAADVTHWQVGDEVVVHCNVVDACDPIVESDGMHSKTQSIWGYETNYGAFAEFTKVKQTQLLPKPNRLNWEQSASLMLTLSTSYRMLVSPNGAQIHAGETVLIWGAAGGLGTYAIQLAKLSGATVVAIVSGNEKRKVCEGLGADFIIDRKADGFGEFVDEGGNPNYINWNKAKKLLRKKGVADIDVVFEHVGRETLGFSLYIARKGGRIVTCAASSGFIANIDIRYIWMELKTLIGSHFANYAEASAALKLVAEGHINPVIDSISPISELPSKMDSMYAGEVSGKVVFTHE